jgi:hypothetical protein
MLRPGPSLSPGALPTGFTPLVLRLRLLRGPGTDVLSHPDLLPDRPVRCSRLRRAEFFDAEFFDAELRDAQLRVTVR